MQYATREQAQRFAAALAAAIIAITFILPLAMRHTPPHGVRGPVFQMALLPAAAAWLVVWKTPGTAKVAMFRTAMLSIALVGAGGLTLRLLPTLTSPWIEDIVESARFVPQSIVYLAIGILGVIGSLLFGDDE